MLLITVEPWSWSADFASARLNCCDGILDGRYDANITAVCSAVSELKSPISIRWGQEMEDPSGYFPWAQWSPKDFIAAYQHFVTECRKHLPDAKYVWSPKGNKSLADFYPGDQYVDVVGLSVFGYQPYDKINFGGERTFAQALEPGYRLVEGFGKPIIVAELGYEGDQRLRQQMGEGGGNAPLRISATDSGRLFQYPRNLSMAAQHGASRLAHRKSSNSRPASQTARQPDSQALSDTKRTRRRIPSWTPCD